MGGKQSKDKIGSAASLNPSERRRLTVFLQSKGSQNQFTHQEIEKLWKDLLVADLLKSYIDFLMKQDVLKKNYIEIDEFVMIYSCLIRGDSSERVATVAGIIGFQKNSAGQDCIPFNGLCKYLSDLLESYFLGLRHRHDENYKTWTHLKHPQREIIEHVMTGLCSELSVENNQVQLIDLERWLQYSGIINVLHSYVLGSLYNLDPENETTIIPRAVLPTTKTPILLDLSHIVYLNSFIPSDNKAKWRFLFSTTTHGESFSKFVGSITNQGPLLFAVESDDMSIFGGFICENLALGPRWVGTGDCFLYKLSPKIEVYPSTGYNKNYVYLNLYQSSLPNGLGMGGQYNYWGLWLDSHFGKGECSESCTTYRDYKMLAAKKNFHIRKLEVWGVGEPPLTAAEKGERSEDMSILEKDPTASHIMELAGRTAHSKHIREESPPKD